MASRFLRNLLTYLPYQLFTVQGKSMQPTITPGARLVIKKTNTVSSQDIIALYNPYDKRVIVKRLVRITNEGYFVEGDNLLESTDSRHFGFVAKKNIIGKVVHVI